MRNQEDSIEISMDSEALSDALSKCERCGKRPPMPERKWCRPCALKWQRSPVREASWDQYVGGVQDFCPRWEHHIPLRYRNATLADLPESIKETFIALPDDAGMFLWGLPGRGKTHAMCAFAKHLWDEGWEFARVTYEQLCLDIRATFGKGDGQSELTILEPLWRIPKLFIEDAGVTVSLGQQESDFSLRTFVTLLDERLEQCRATFITSNKSLEELGRSFDKRVASRLSEACEIIQVTGEDKRLYRCHHAEHKRAKG